MKDMTRKDFLKTSGLAAGGLWMAGAVPVVAPADAAVASAASDSELPASEADRLRSQYQANWYLPVEELGKDEMRVSFMGTNYTARNSQAMTSVFIETGNGDALVFDLGSGALMRYTSMGVPSSRMTKVFLAHLHADHMADLTSLYCFGPAHDRKTPLHVYGPSGPILYDPELGKEREFTEQGTKAFCDALYNMCAWHRDAFSFMSNGLKPNPRYPEGCNGYDLESHEFKYRQSDYCYDEDGVKVRHFPAAHDRDGSVSYKIEWNGMSVVFSSDTKPTDWLLEESKNVDLLIHEMAFDAETWVAKQGGADLTPGSDEYMVAIERAQEVIDNSHTPLEALGKILQRCKPRLGVITHVWMNQDLIIKGIDGVRRYYDGPLAWATDFVVFNLKPGATPGEVDIRQRMAVVAEGNYDMNGQVVPPELIADPKFDGPFAQFSEFTMKHITPPYDKPTQR